MSRCEHVTALPGDFIAKAATTKRKWLVRRSDVIADFIETLEQGGDNRDDLLKQTYENPQIIDQWFKEQWYDFAQIEKRGVLIEDAGSETIAGLLLWADGESGWPELTCVSDVTDFELPSAVKLKPEPVNQQLLAALKLALSSNGKMLLTNPPQDAWRYNRVDEVSRAAIAAAEAAQPACHTCKGRGVIGGHVGQTPESFDYVTEDCPDCQQPASAQPVAVPDTTEAMIDAIQQVRLIDWCCDKDGNPTTVSECSARAIAEAVIAASQKPECWCHTCRPVSLEDMRMVLCPYCGNKRCPQANDHRNACTGSNEPGQPGSAYPAAHKPEGV